MEPLSKNKPYILIKSAVSIDGYIDDLSSSRLILSNEEDLKAVDELKFNFDAILVGAETIRKDNPSLLIKSKEIRKKRVENGLTEHPRKVTMTLTGNLDVNNRFFQEGDVEKIVYCPLQLKNYVQNKVGKKATVIGLTDENNIINPINLLNDLYNRGISRLMIEGGSNVNTLFLKYNLVDAVRLAIAPFFVGAFNAPKFTVPAHFTKNKNNRMKLEKTEILGDMVILNYSLK